MNESERLGKKIQELRAEMRLNQHELADRAGVSHRSIQDIESGDGNPTIGTLMALATALNLSIAELLGNGVINQNKDLFRDAITILSTLDDSELKRAIVSIRAIKNVSIRGALVKNNKDVG